MKIQIKSNQITIDAELYDTPTGEAVSAVLPITGTVNRWGGEIYFSIPVAAALELDARDVLVPGEIAFWPPGKALCIFFGTTPASRDNECRAASEVNVFGMVTGDPGPLWNIEDGSEIRISAK